MTASDHTLFFKKIQSALKREDSDARSLDNIIQTEPGAEDILRLKQIAGRSTPQRLDLLDRTTETGRSLNIKVMGAAHESEATGYIADIAAEKSPEWGDEKSIVAWDHPLVKSLDLFAGLADLDIPVYFPDTTPGGDGLAVFRAHAEKALIGVTSADWCVAQTCTLTIKTRTGQHRSVSLLPSIHIAVIRLDQILADLKELYTLLKWDPKEQADGITDCMTFITGPSKTADIEATLVEGAHGPRELYIIVCKRSQGTASALFPGT